MLAGHFEQVAVAQRQESQNTRDYYEENISEVDRITIVYNNKIKFRKK